MTSEPTADQQARATRHRLAFELKAAHDRLETAAEWMRIDAGVDNVDAEVIKEYSIRVQGYLRKYEPPKSDIITERTPGSPAIRIQSLDDAI